MPKKPTRDNPSRRRDRTVQSAASVLRRISQKSGVAMPSPGTAAAAISLIERLRILLPEELRTHLIEVLEKPGELVLFTDSAVWAGRLKLAVNDLAAIAAGRRQVVRVMPREGYRR
jgi:hypothetical protein